jgi:hypothetical protein
MSLDFSKLNIGIPTNEIVEPRKIFTTLNRNPVFRRPSDEQGEVLDYWFNIKSQSDITIKMNTGSGKTLVGLLALQSSLNERVFPAIYVTADNYLRDQVVKEAKDLGIVVTEKETDSRFIAGKAILVINIHKLINGQSVFGVGAEGVKINIGAIVIDDVHACLATVEEQFSLRLSAVHPAYEKLLSVFKPALEQQSSVGVLEIEDQDPQRVMAVPYWAWKEHQSEVIEILRQNRESDEIWFAWPLLKDVLNLCQCVFGGGRIGIAPRFLPIDIIPSLARAKRRIYMTATLADDGILVSHFNVDANLASKAIKPLGVGNMGDRMILIPQEINHETTDEDIKRLAVKIAKEKNVAVIVPSEKRSRFWSDVAAQTLNASNISQGVEKMKNQLVGITVFVNKYDGVDLPDTACELLIIDGIPEAYGVIEKMEMSVLDGTEIQLSKQIHRIEQGMGRGVRSSEDHCVVLLMGRRLTQLIHQPSARLKFTPATLAQIDLGREITEQLIGQSVDELIPVLNYCLKKDQKWQTTSRTALVNAQERTDKNIDPTIQKLRQAFDAARNQQWKDACNLAQEAVNITSDRVVCGYIKQQLAEFTYHINQAESQNILLQAVKLNSQVIKPITGIIYSKLDHLTGDQASMSMKFIADKFADTSSLVIFVNSLVEDLSWNQEGTNGFEAAIKNLGLLLGFNSQRPEHEYGKGPDNLWAVGSSIFFVIECKSGSTSSVIGKSDCNQLTGSMTWFGSMYGSACKATPILIHPSDCFDKHSSPLKETRIIDKICLEKLKQNLVAYATAIASSGTLTDLQTIKEQLKYFSLTSANFMDTYTVKFKHN